jgi:hypothetical protein
MDRFYAPDHSRGNEDDDDEESYEQASLLRQLYQQHPSQHHLHLGGYGTARFPPPYHHYEPGRRVGGMTNPGLEYLSDAGRQGQLEYVYGVNHRHPAHHLNVEARPQHHQYDHAVARAMPPTASSLYSTRPDPPAVAPNENMYSSRRDPISNLGLLLQASESAALIATSGQSGSTQPPGGTTRLPLFAGQVQDNRFGLESQPYSSGMARGTVPFPGPLAQPPIDPPSSSDRTVPSRTAAVATARQGQKRGGIFDEAESDTEDTPLVGRKKTRSNSHPKKMKPKFVTVAPAATKVGKGGIFDDADEDVDFVSPHFSPKTKLTGPDISRPDPLPSQLETFKLAVPKSTESPSSTSNSAKPEKKKKKGKGTTDKGSSTRKYKKAKLPAQRVLVARKEKEQALSLLAGKDDLMGILKPNHCLFLGREFWIFTVQQLQSVLRSTDELDNIADAQNPPKPVRFRSSLRSELLLYVAKSDLVKTRAAASQSCKAAQEVPNEANTRYEKSEPTSGTSTATEELPLADAASLGVDSIKHESNANYHYLKEAMEGDIDPKAREEAEAVLRRWEEVIEAWKNKAPNEREIPVEKMFPLDGPIACLFPTVITRFLASVPVRTLFDFLSLKKTETGAITALCGAWRKSCGLADGTPLALAKHFIGLGFRAETAIASVPPVDYRTRKWMGDPMIVLTGAAREFVVDARQISSGTVFIETRTKDLATGLMEWRASKGLPPLKGSGKVAMVSGWKASVKEAIDLEEGEGKVLRDIDLQALVEAAEEAPFVKEEKKQAPAKQKTTHQEYTFDPLIPVVHKALHSTLFLKEVLDPEHFSVLHEAGVKTAVELFASQKKAGSPLALALSKILPEPSTYQLVIFDWCQIVRKKLSGIRRVNGGGKRKGDNLPGAPPNNKAKKEATNGKGKDAAAPKTNEANASKPEEARASKSKEARAPKSKESRAPNPKEATAPNPKEEKERKPKESKATNQKAGKPNKQSVGKPNKSSHGKANKSKEGAAPFPKDATAPRPSRQELLQKDIFYSLSAGTQTFLNSLGIATAEAFMHSRTTDLSSAFVEWRATKGMTVLKGLGAIASVSGWKAQVRRLAKERGLEELAQAAPSGVSQLLPNCETKISADAGSESKVKSTTGTVPNTHPPPQTKLQVGTTTSTGSKKILSYPEILFGKPTKKLVVESSRGTCIFSDL